MPRFFKMWYFYWDFWNNSLWFQNPYSTSAFSICFLSAKTGTQLCQFWLLWLEPIWKIWLLAYSFEVLLVICLNSLYGFLVIKLWKKKKNHMAFLIFSEMEKRTVLPKVLTTYDEECLKLYSLCHYAGIMIDPSLFKNIVDLLKAG